MRRHLHIVPLALAWLVALLVPPASAHVQIRTAAAEALANPIVVMPPMGGTAVAWAAMLTLPSLLGGWSVDNDAGRWQDSARTTLASANTNPVGALDDLSGNGRHLLQATAGKRPLYNTSGFNSKKTITLDGVDDFLQTTGTVTFGAHTVYWVGKIIGATNYMLFVADAAAAGNGGLYMYAPSGFSSYSLRTSGGSGGVNATWTANGMLATFYDKNDNSGTGIGVQVDNGTATTTTATNGGTMNAAKVTVGADFGGGSPLNCEIAAVWIYSAAHGTTDKNTAHTTLAAEWGTP